MGELLQSAEHEINDAEREGEPFPSDLADRVGRERDDIVAAGIAYHDSLPPPDSPGKLGRRRRRKGHNLAIRMRDFRQEAGDAALRARPLGSGNQQPGGAPSAAAQDPAEDFRLLPKRGRRGGPGEPEDDAGDGAHAGLERI
ncbi:MAG: hypothetical protein OXC26_07695 [Albidovulum sp.]|nr:hypothetical protein [Albidovulum sp.]